MTVATTINKSGPYAGAGSAGPFTVDFRFLENSHLQVVKTSTAGVDSTLVLDTDYTVAGAGATTGSVTLATALAIGEKLTIIRDVPDTQEADYVNNDAFPAESHEQALDKLTMLSQQNRETLGRALKLPVSLEGVSALVPPPVAGRGLKWNDDGTALENTDSDIDVAAAAAAGSASAAAGSAASAAAVYDAFDDRYLGAKTTDPATDNDGNALIEGALYWNSATKGMRVYNGTVWQELASSAFHVETFSGDGTTTAFTLAISPVSKNNTDVFISGVYQQKSEYSLSNMTLTFTTAPATGTNNIEVVYPEFLPVATVDAANANYLPAGVGAVQTDVETKLREFVSVKDFGATGDGVTDDTAAIQAAHDTGKTVYYPNGTYKISDTITVSIYARIIGESSDGVVINNTNVSVYAFEHLTVIGGPYDVDSGLEIAHLTINSKYGIKLNQSGAYATVFEPQGAIKRIHVHDLNITGTYTNGVDANQDTATVPTSTEMEGYGVGIRLAKVFDSQIELCKIEFCGIGIMMDGCDINTIHTNRLNKNGWHLYYYGHDTWGGQSKFRDNDCLYNRRVGAVMLENTIFATIEDVYFENYANSATFLRTISDSGTRFVGCRIDDPKLAVPIIAMDPYIGGIITQCRYTRPSQFVESLGYIAVGTTYYDSAVQSFTKIFGNQSGFPSCDSPYVLLAPDVDGSAFKYNNALKFGGSASSAMPFVLSAASSRYALTTATGNADVKLALTNGQKFYRIDYTGRYVAGAGYRVLSHVSPSGTVTALGIAGYVGFPATGELVTIGETVAIPDALSLSGYLQITLVNTEVEYECVRITPTDTLIADAAPSGATVTYQVGMRTRKLTPIVGQPKGWLCTVTGAPGTWVSEGNL